MVHERRCYQHHQWYVDGQSARNWSRSLVPGSQRVVDAGGNQDEDASRCRLEKITDVSGSPNLLINTDSLFLSMPAAPPSSSARAVFGAMRHVHRCCDCNRALSLISSNVRYSPAKNSPASSCSAVVAFVFCSRSIETITAGTIVTC